MPINGQWWFLATQVAQYEQDQPGVYELADEGGNVIYVGSADKVRRRILEHVNETQNDCIKRDARRYRVEYCTNCRQREKQLYDEHVRMYRKPPRCNQIAPSGY